MGLEVRLQCGQARADSRRARTLSHGSADRLQAAPGEVVLASMIPMGCAIDPKVSLRAF